MRGLMKLAGVARFDCIGSTQEFACYMAGLASPGDHTCGWTTSTLHSHLAWRYWFRWGCGASSTTSVIADLAGSHIPYPRSTGPDHAAIHPIRRGAPDQKGCNAYGSGATPPPTTSPTADTPSRHTTTGSIGRRHTTSTHSNRFRARAVAPVRSRYTRSVAIHPIRRDAPDQKGCNAYGSGATPPTTSPTAGNSSPQTPTVCIGRRHMASTCSPRLRTRGAAPVKERYTTSELV